MSSLHRRFDGSQVRTIRLDELLAAESADKQPIALWVDTEGMALAVIDGARAVLPSTRMLHVEVETGAIIGAEQKLFRHVEKMLSDAGFSLVATDQPLHHLQFNALFVRADVLRSKSARIRYWISVMRLRHALVRGISRLLPEKLWRQCVELTH